MNRTIVASRLAAAFRALLLASGALVVGLIIAEIVLRIFQLAPAEGVGTVTAKEFARVPGMFEPYQRVLDVVNPSLPFTVTIDSLGFRGSDFPRPKPPGQLRVLMIGDSQVYGDFVEDNQTFPYQLEQRLRVACADALVINAGLGGTTITDQAFVLQRTLPLDPDLVILVYVENDFDDLASPVPEWQRLAANRRWKSRFPLSVLYPLLRRSSLWNLALRVNATRMKEQEEAALRGTPTDGGQGALLGLRERYGKALVAVRDTLAGHRVPFIFTMFPSWLDLRSPSNDLTWMSRFAETHAIAGVDLLSALQATHLPVTQLYLVPKDGHPSPMGYSIAAKVMADRILHAPPARAACKP